LSRLRRAIFDSIDRTLRHAGSFTEVGLTPTQHGPAGAELGGEELPLVLNTMRRQIYFRVFVHDNVTNKKIPGERSRRGSSNSHRDQAIRAGSRGERER
jgi:hypothetical protein